ncbi:pirin family protein [Sphingobacterium daejeonense]|uniref:Pirin family protein n=1 Tax=Sphingobacterium daejeonense TaxID=371142 RepID=A0ABW3RM27_9SPHI
MDRKNFIKKGFVGTGMFAATAALGNILKNEIEELAPLDFIGFNHIPNTDSNLSDNSVIHYSTTRGKADHGWLLSHHTFSFANYHNPERMHFGVLRVLNDDVVEGGKGFGTHPHDNMEIISIPLDGDLEHKDNLGNVSVIKNGDIQVMSAGTGVMHSEFNYNEDRPVKFLQIWIYPKRRNVAPRYDQQSIDQNSLKNRFQQILSPNHDDDGVWIHQDAWFHLGEFEAGVISNYKIKKSGNGLYVFLIEGSALVGNQNLNSRDGFGLWNISSIEIRSTSPSTKILLMEVPMILG